MRTSGYCTLGWMRTVPSSKHSAQLLESATVTRRALDQRHLSYLKIAAPLTLIDLAGSGGLTRIGADARLLGGSHAVAQRWSAALRNHPTKPADFSILRGTMLLGRLVR